MTESAQDSHTNPAPSFALGASAVPGALRHLFWHPALWPKIIVPILLTFVFFLITVPVLLMIPVWFLDSFDLVGAAIAIQSADDQQVAAESFPDSSETVARPAWYTLAWTGFLQGLGRIGQAVLWGLWLLTCIALTYLLFSTVGMAIMGSFMDSLTAVVETQLGVSGRALANPGMVDGVVQSVRDSTYLVTRNLIWTLLLVPLLLVPVVGAVAFFLLGAHFMASEQLEYPMVRRGWSRDKRKQWRKQYRSAARGVGMTGAALMMIPFVNLLVLPVAATAGTLLFCRLEYPNRSKDSPNR